MTADIDMLLSLAREVGAAIAQKWDSNEVVAIHFTPDHLAAFAQRIRQDERERAARMADQWSAPIAERLTRGEMTDAELGKVRSAMQGLSAAIRSSGTSQSKGGQSHEQ